MKAVIAGAGRLGTQIAQVFLAARDTVVLIDANEERLAELRGLGAGLVAGDACEPGVLEDAGARTADLLIAATDGDEDNLVISLLAKRQFDVPRVAARVNDPDDAWLFDERWGVDVAVPAETPLISLIEEAAATTDTVALYRLHRAGVTLIETAITAQSRSVGHAPAELTLPAGTVVASVVRDGHPIVPGSGFRFQAGDEVLVVSDSATDAEVRAAFQ